MATEDPLSSLAMQPSRVKLQIFAATLAGGAKDGFGVDGRTSRGKSPPCHLLSPLRRFPSRLPHPLCNLSRPGLSASWPMTLRLPLRTICWSPALHICVASPLPCRSHAGVSVGSPIASYLKAFRSAFGNRLRSLLSVGNFEALVVAQPLWMKPGNVHYMFLFME